MEALHSGFPSWMKVLHPSQLVTIAQQIAPALSESKQRHCSQSTWEGELSVEGQKNALQTAELHPMSPPKTPELLQEIALFPGFMRVVSCL